MCLSSQYLSAMSNHQVKTMNKGLWLSIGLLILLTAALLGLRSLYPPVDGTADESAIKTDADTKLLINFDDFKGYHHDADILLKEMTVLKSDIQTAIAAQDSKQLGIAVNNTYRVMDNVNMNRMPTIAPFAICDKALEALGRYVIDANRYYADSNKGNKGNSNQVEAMRLSFETQFQQCHSIVKDKPVAALYQDYQ